MADYSDPNNWTGQYVRLHRKECLTNLKEINLLTIQCVQQNNYKAAIAGLDRILNGLMTMQNSKCGDYRSIMSMFSMVEGILLASFGSQGIPTAIEVMKDARDFAKTPDTKKNIDSMLARLRAGKSLDDDLGDVVWLLQKMDSKLTEA